MFFDTIATQNYCIIEIRLEKGGLDVYSSWSNRLQRKKALSLMNFSRRKFLTSAFVCGAVFLTSGCSFLGITNPLETLRVMQKDLFPHAAKLGIATAPYLHIVLSHPKISEADKRFLKNGVKWLNEASLTQYKKRYVSLQPDQRQALLQSIAKTEWGESFIYDVMGYLFEAMLGDPLYGGNQHQKGWQWLSFEAGVPRPKEPYLG